MSIDTDILRAGIDTEIDGYRFFIDAAGRASHARVKKVWLDLATDELAHMKILQGHLASLIENGEWDTTPDVPDRPDVRKAPISAVKNWVVPNELTSDLDALKSGLQVEESTHRFYVDATKRTNSAVGRKTYEYLAKWEMGHYLLLEETIEMIANPAMWDFKQNPPIQEG
jgi:rubrerythrin